MTFSRNKAIRFVAKTIQARHYAEQFGIVVPGIDVDVSNENLQYVAAYCTALVADMVLITERVKDLWVASVEGKNEIDTKELAKLNKVVKSALVFGNTLLE
jgi:hypothetical protein